MLLIRQAELLDGQRVDLRVGQGRIVEIGTRLACHAETVIDAAGGLLGADVGRRLRSLLALLEYSRRRDPCGALGAATHGVHLKQRTRS